MSMEGLIVIVVILLIVLFCISFVLFVRRLVANSSVNANNSNDLSKKIDKLIEQNEQLLLLLKEKD